MKMARSSGKSLVPFINATGNADPPPIIATEYESQKYKMLAAAMRTGKERFVSMT